MSDNSKPSVQAVICARNEAPSLAAVLEGTFKHVDRVLVVDGHSTDGTPELARRMGAEVVEDEGLGKGAAIRQAIGLADADLLVFLDADGSHDPDDIPRLLAPLLADEADMVIGSRVEGGSDELLNVHHFFRRVGSWIIRTSVNRHFGVRLTDLQNGFRAARTAMLRSLDLRENIFTIEQEMTIKALRRGYRVVNVPAREYERKHGRSRISVPRHGWRYVVSWLKYTYFERDERREQ
ncbi:MAG: glycosyltransferase [Armatimonadetes bacterium]|nr:glycosyltransferase [Armatimonadota bacterium]